MNIIVKPYDSDLCYCRPDTTWERENKDFYSPECVNEIYYTPIVFARISKAGKCIGDKFASRYYDGVGCGILMYCKVKDQLISCVDHTSILPHPLYNPLVMEDGQKTFDITLTKNNPPVIQNNPPVIQNNPTVILSEAKNLLQNAICKASQLTSLRIGDFIAVEMDEPKLLTCRKNGNITVSGFFCENEIFNFQIIL